ncbi:hypothetical protein K3495_g4336 [Podosphaera aphanis]|nr:hypothetical protein K3495_g4336 [Podosphaera aphanis]
MFHLNSFLKEKLVREIKVTKTGVTICPVSITAQESLAACMSEIENSLHPERLQSEETVKPCGLSDFRGAAFICKLRRLQFHIDSNNFRDSI